ncbi:histidine triad (HIT) family protein [Granulicella rosea]|uniref:Histidine triad (HIT) family protein n=1 Tax=Granulicella rosea TaxID=474952 RepID=A0A239D700_9BACT|nr:HIT domain-containing protein [Granulicella rosea]SNS27788.1 histidine triad (HIT) family protein [Granulicella rosea]
MSDCLFCKIAANQIPVKRLDEDDLSLAFADINPQAPKHLLVIPKAHYATAADAPAELLGALLAKAAALGERELPNGYRIVINTRDDGGQTVHHLHLHLLGGRHMGWPPG